jgi:hypothetical protein
MNYLDSIVDIYPTQHSSSYVNEPLASNHSDIDDFYVMPRQENLPVCDTYNSLPDTNPIDPAQIYVTPPTFSKNFVLESNLSFDDSQDISNISLDTVPDLITDASTNNTVYYSYPDQQSTMVNN